MWKSLWRSFQQPISFHFQWRSCDRNGANCSDLAGATSSTYTVQSSDVGMTLRVRVTASNSAGSSSATSAPTAELTTRPVGAVSLTANRSLVVYGGLVLLSGSLESGQADKQVTINAHEFPFNAPQKTIPAAVVSTQTGGDFTIALKPLVHTI